MDSFRRFELFVRSAWLHEESDRNSASSQLLNRDVHPLLVRLVSKLFDNGHYAQATFEACKYIEQEIARLANSTQSGFGLMMDVFNEDNPKISLNSGQSISDKDEQKGYRFLFAGTVAGIRNPRGHKYAVTDSIDECLDHLALASILLRKLESAGFTLMP